MMKAISSSSSSLNNILLLRNIHSGLCFCCCGQFHASKHHLVFFPSNKLCLLHLISVQRNPLHPISSSSSSQRELYVAQSSNQETYESETVRVKFQLKKECSFGEQFAIVGDDPIFGMWDPDNAITLNWSDDHVWNLGLDIPIGKSIHFKFILKEITGKILWQPGPDRILRTWETKNTIVVWEDWEDATSQKLLEEEEPIDDALNSEMGLVAENLIHQNQELAADVIADVKSYPQKEPSPSTDEKPIIGENIGCSEEKATAFVADNISNQKEEPVASASHEVLKDEQEANSNKDMTIKEEISPNNERIPTVEENLNFEHQGDTVLVPGLPPISVDYSEPEIQNAGEKSDGVNEVENNNLPEKANSIELDEKHEIDDVDPQPSQTIDLDQLQNPAEDDGESNQVQSNVVKKDIRWGRRTIQKLLNNFGIL